MSKVRLISTILFLLFAASITSCSNPTPSSDSIKIDVLPMRARRITSEEMNAVLSKHKIDVPFFEQTSGTSLYAVVIPFDIMQLPKDTSYTVVRVNLLLLRPDGTSGFVSNPDMEVVTVIPTSVQRDVQRANSMTAAGNLSAAVEELSANLNIEQSTKETYVRIYRTVTAHISPSKEIRWDFEPFKDEPILPGIVSVIAILQVKDGTTGNMVHGFVGCGYTVSKLFGLSTESSGCTAGQQQELEIRAGVDIL
jgi:hypothetical protein